MLKFKKQPYFIAFTGIFIVILFYLLPMNPGYELALAYIPLFFLILGFILTLIYWLLIKLNRNTLKFIFYLFFLGNLTWGILTAFVMAFS
jgi:hypothetical protein